MRSAPSCEMEAMIASARSVALHYAKDLLPDCEREDCACDACLKLQLKAQVNDQFAQRLQSSTAFVRHCVRQFVIDYARELGRHHVAPLAPSPGGSDIQVDWDPEDPRDLLKDAFNLIAFWQQIAGVSSRLSMCSRDILWLRYSNGLSLEAIAARMRMHPDAVSQSIKRSLKSVCSECDRMGVSRGDLSFDPPHDTYVYLLARLNYFRVELRNTLKIIARLRQIWSVEIR